MLHFGVAILHLVRAGTYLNIRAAVDLGHVAAAIDIADVAYSENGITVRGCGAGRLVITLNVICIGFTIICDSVAAFGKLPIILCIRFINELGSNHALLHVHIDVGTADEFSSITATVDIANLRGGDYIDFRIGLGQSPESVAQQGIFDDFGLGRIVFIKID